MAEAKEMRRIRGGVGTYNTKCVGKLDANLPVGDYNLGVTIPAGAIVIGAYIKNVENDLAGGGSATLALNAGTNALVSGATVATLKGKAKGGAIVAGVYVDVDTELKLTVGTANFTAGTLEVGVLYM